MRITLASPTSWEKKDLQTIISGVVVHRQMLHDMTSIEANTALV